ncbi:MAG: lipid kinase YegS [Planctomycetota bacterium]|jgi:lipid kinase YegS
MGSKICLVLHRKSANEPAIKEAVKYVRAEGVKLRVRIPWNKKDKPRVVNEALEDGATRIIAGGGDGTINAVVNALVGKGKKRPRASMGVLPLGTANDFAHGCGLPVDDLKQCLMIACTKTPRKIDVGRANDRFFINVTSGGFGAEITATTPVDMKKKLGGGAYTIMGLIKAFKLKPYEGRLLVPGEEPQEGAMLFMAVGNNRLAGGGFEVAPKARLDDGLLDVAIVRHHQEAEITRMAKELKTIDSPENKYLFYRQYPEFTIESKKGVHFNLDGEPTVETRLKFSVLPKHLKVVF